MKPISCNEHRLRAALLFESQGHVRLTSRGNLRVTYEGLKKDEETVACLFVPGVMPEFPAPWGTWIGEGVLLMTGKLAEELLGYVCPELRRKRAKVEHVLAFVKENRQLVEDAIKGMP